MSKSSNKHAELTVIVDAIGAQGDGVADGPTGRYFIPFAAPGDTVSILPGKRRGDGVEASIKAIVEPSPDRITPLCRHFETCGGCAIQQVTPQRIALEKQAILRQALSRRGLDAVPIADTITIAPGARRRARFAVHRGLKPALGFRRRRSRMVLDITECPVMRPSIIALAAPLRTLVRDISSLGGSAEISITASDAGLDVLFLPA
ncbi:MAG: class I SAM-dependent RNA methyltransferase, partial [Alphaproteobacteria bacterium]